MPIGNTQADALAATVASQLQALPRGQEQSEEALKILLRALYNDLKINAVVNIAGNSAGGDPVTPGTGTIT